MLELTYTWPDLAIKVTKARWATYLVLGFSSVAVAARVMHWRLRQTGVCAGSGCAELDFAKNGCVAWGSGAKAETVWERPARLLCDSLRGSAPAIRCVVMQASNYKRARSERVQ